MTQLLKPGIVTEQKTRYRVKKRGQIAMVLVGCLCCILACSQEGYISAAELTATAGVIETEQATSLAEPSDRHPTSETTSSSPEASPKIETNGLEITPAVTAVQPKNGVNTPTNFTQIPSLMVYTQTGDSLASLAGRYAVSKDEITTQETIPLQSFIPPGTLLIIPDRLDNVGPDNILLPDSEVVYSPSTVDFDVSQFVDEAGGYLSSYSEYRSTGLHTGAEIVEMAAQNNSINPRLLLALIEYQSHWVFGQPTNLAETDYPLGWIDLDQRGLANQLNWAVEQIAKGYYGWRSGTLTEVTFPDKTSLHMAPGLNAGTAAIQYYFSRMNNYDKWLLFVLEENGFSSMYDSRFGNPWLRAHTVDPLFPELMTQPALELPFSPGHTWNYTGGPHPVWGNEGAWAAIDFAPVGIENCSGSPEWITASAPGLVTRSENGSVMVDLDGDGYEQTGWAILYLHVATEDRIEAGSYVNTNDHIGHPSCEGGHSTGTHVHIARKYNGEWMLADGPIPFVLSGWRAHNGNTPYEGTLSKNDQIIRAHEYSSFDTIIKRPDL